MPLQIPFSCALLMSAVVGNAAAAEPARPGSAIGFASVAQALEQLKTRPGVEISIQGKWTIISDPRDQAVWSFAPTDHPAYPAAVRRAVRERDGQVVIETNALCQATKQACDSLMAEFQALDQGVTSQVRSAQWSPSGPQKTDAINVVARFQRAVAEQRYKDAYQLFTPGLKEMMTFERFVELQEMSALRHGGAVARNEPKITWYKDHPAASAPGVFAAFDFECRSPKVNLCTEVVILHEGTDGVFRVMRNETNYMDKETEQQLRMRPQTGSTSL